MRIYHLDIPGLAPFSYDCFLDVQFYPRTQFIAMAAFDADTREFIMEFTLNPEKLWFLGNSSALLVVRNTNDCEGIEQWLFDNGIVDRPDIRRFDENGELPPGSFPLQTPFLELSASFIASIRLRLAQL